jgi:hypothetical protein
MRDLKRSVELAVEQRKSPVRVKMQMLWRLAVVLQEVVPVRCGAVGMNAEARERRDLFLSIYISEDLYIICYQQRCAATQQLTTLLMLPSQPHHTTLGHSVAAAVVLLVAGVHGKRQQTSGPSGAVRMHCVPRVPQRTRMVLRKRKV